MRRSQGDTGRTEHQLIRKKTRVWVFWLSFAMPERGWRSHFPRGPSELLAVVFLIVAVHFIVLFELLFMLPALYDRASLTYWIHVGIGVIIYSNVITSIVLSIVTDTTSGSLILPSVLKPEWRFCSSCEANAPPRSSHCWMCNACVLRRDHHCIFTGKCVGYANQRFFLNMIMSLCVGAMYCNYLNVDYIWDMLGGFSATSLFTMIVPLFAWFFGLTGTYTFSIAFLSSTCIIGFFLLGALLAYHGVNMYNGQVSYERVHRIHIYDCGWKENVRQVLGMRWYIAWLSPFIHSPLPGNGIDFPKKTIYEDVKDM